MNNKNLPINRFQRFDNPKNYMKFANFNRNFKAVS